MKHLAAALAVLLVAMLVPGCGGGSKRAVQSTGAMKTITILPPGADATGLNADQAILLQQTLDWMDRDLGQNLRRSRFNVVHGKSEKEFVKNDNSYLLKTTITYHRLIPKGARFMGGMMAGTDQLTARYELVDTKGATVLSWEDNQGSTKNGRKCASTLNRNATNKIATFINGK